MAPVLGMVGDCEPLFLKIKASRVAVRSFTQCRIPDRRVSISVIYPSDQFKFIPRLPPLPPKGFLQGGSVLERILVGIFELFRN